MTAQRKEARLRELRPLLKARRGAIDKVVALGRFGGLRVARLALGDETMTTSRSPAGAPK